MKPRRAQRSTKGITSAFCAAVGMLLLASCSGPTKQSAAAVPDAKSDARLQAIPVADPAKYEKTQNLRAWRNPYLIIRKDGAALVDLANNEEHILKTDAVLNALARLPSSAWPYGRVVAIQESNVDSDQDKIALRRNRGIIAGTLEGDHVAIQWIPSP